MQAQLIAAAKAVARDGAVADQMQRGGGAPADWARATQAAVRALARLESGAAELRDATLLVSGVLGRRSRCRGRPQPLAHRSAGLDQAHRADPPARAPQGLRRGAAASARARNRWPRRKIPVRNPAKAGDACQGRDASQSRGARQVRRRSPRRRPRWKYPPRPKRRCSPNRRWRPRPRRRSPSPNTPRVETKAEVVARGCQTTLTEVIKSGHILFEERERGARRRQLRPPLPRSPRRSNPAPMSSSRSRGIRTTKVRSATTRLCRSSVPDRCWTTWSRRASMPSSSSRSATARPARSLQTNPLRPGPRTGASSLSCGRSRIPKCNTSVTIKGERSRSRTGEWSFWSLNSCGGCWRRSCLA